MAAHLFSSTDYSADNSKTLLLALQECSNRKAWTECEGGVHAADTPVLLGPASGVVLLDDGNALSAIAGLKSLTFSNAPFVLACDNVRFADEG